MRIKIYILFLLSIFVSHSCIEEFVPEISDFSEFVVVEGNITDAEGPYLIKLSKSTRVDSIETSPIIGAEVTISDNSSNSELLTEISPGTYSTATNGIRGQVGREYKLSFKLNDKIYESNYEKLELGAEIDSIYTSIETKATADGDNTGLQFYVNTGILEDNEKFFLWQAVETYEYKSDLKLDYIYYADTILSFPAANYTVCWRTNRVHEIFTQSAKKFSTAQITNSPLHFVANDTKSLSIKYSLLLKQFSISEEAYRFWNEIKLQNQDAGSLYTKQPYLVKGNVKNIDNPNEIVLGYFFAASYSDKRIFVSRPPIVFQYPICEASVEGFLDMFRTPNTIYPKYVAIVEGDESSSLGIASLRCFECDLEGGTREKPDFWIGD